MPGHMDKGTKNYRNMMKNMEKMNDMSLGKPMSDADAMKGVAMAGMAEEKIPTPMNMSMDSMLDTEKESMMKMLQGMDFAPSDIREAIEALMDMGFDRDAVLEILESTPNLIGAIGKRETNPRTMTEGALGALQMGKPTQMPERLDADRTQSMDMQKTGMGT